MGINRALTYMDKFTAKVGMGQFTYERFAQWLVENHPEIASEALAEALRVNKSKRKERRAEELREKLVDCIDPYVSRKSVAIGLAKEVLVLFEEFAKGNNYVSPHLDRQNGKGG